MTGETLGTGAGAGAEIVCPQECPAIQYDLVDLPQASSPIQVLNSQKHLLLGVHSSTLSQRIGSAMKDSSIIY